MAATFIALVAVSAFVLPTIDNADLSVDMDVDYGGDTLTYMVSLMNASANAKYYVVVMEGSTVVYEKEITEGYQTGIVEGLDGTKDHRVEIRTGLIPLKVVDSATIPGQDTPYIPVDINNLTAVENTIVFDMTVKEGSDPVTLGVYAAEGEEAVFTQVLNPGANTGTATNLMFNHEYIVKLFGDEKTYIIKAVTTDRDTQTPSASAIDFTYGETKSVVVTGLEETPMMSYAVQSGSSVTVNESTGALTWVSAGEAVIRASFAETEHYKAGYIDVTVTAVKAESDLVFAAAEGLTYTDIGTGDLIVKTAGNDQQVIQYSTDGNTWDTTIPKASALGDFTVFYKADETANYNALPEGSVSGNVDKADSDLTFAASEGLTYADYGTGELIVKTAGNNEQVIQYSTDGNTWDTTVPTVTAAGSFTVYFRADESANYKELTTGSVSESVAKIAATIIAPTAKEGLVYTGESQVLINEGTTSDGTVKYSLSVDGYFSDVIPTASYAGSYDVFYMVAGDSNHFDLGPSGDYKVTATIYAQPTGMSLSYNEQTNKVEWEATKIEGEGLWSIYVCDGDTITGTTVLPTGNDKSGASDIALWYGHNYNVYVNTSGLTTVDEVSSGPVQSLLVNSIPGVLYDIHVEASGYVYGTITMNVENYTDYRWAFIGYDSTEEWGDDIGSQSFDIEFNPYSDDYGHTCPIKIIKKSDSSEFSSYNVNIPSQG